MQRCGDGSTGSSEASFHHVTGSAGSPVAHFATAIRSTRSCCGGGTAGDGAAARRGGEKVPASPARPLPAAALPRTKQSCSGQDHPHRILDRLTLAHETDTSEKNCSTQTGVKRLGTFSFWDQHFLHSKILRVAVISANAASADP